MGQKQIQNLKIVNQATNKTIPINSIDADVTAGELLTAYMGQIGLPANTHGTLTRKITRLQLLPTQTLAAAGIEDGEVLIADIDMVPGH